MANQEAEQKQSDRKRKRKRKRERERERERELLGVSFVLERPHYYVQDHTVILETSQISSLPVQVVP